MNFLQRLGFNKREAIYLYCGIAFMLLLAIVAIFFHYPNLDEAIIGEWSYRIAKTGKASSFLYEGLHLGYENQVFVYHKLFALVGAGVISIFGFNYYLLRLISVLFYAALILVIYKYLIKATSDTKQAIHVFLTAFFILGLNALVFNQAFVFRPESMMMFLGFCSFIFISRSLKGYKNAAWIAGLLAGTAVFTHLNGVIFVGAGGLVLLIHKRKFEDLVKFALPATLVSLLFFFDINSSEKLHLFLYQWSHEPNLVGAEKNYLLKLIDENQRFFHSIPEILISLPFFVFSIAYRKKIASQYPGLLTFVFSAIVLFGMLSHGKTSKYLLLFFPYMAIIVAYGAVNLWNKGKKNHLILITAMAVYFLANIISLTKYIDYKQPNLMARNREITALIGDKNATIIGPECTIFGTIKNSKIVGMLSYYHYCLISGKDSEKYNPEKFLQFCSQNNYKYVVNDYNTNTDRFWDHDLFRKSSVGDRLGDYKVKFHSNGILILEKG